MKGAIIAGEPRKDGGAMWKVLNWHTMMRDSISLLLVGATGCGKSTTIKALIQAQDAEESPSIEISGGGKPVTMEITDYQVGNWIIYDSPGLGDGEVDDERQEKIQDLLDRIHIDVVLIIFDAGNERDLESTLKSIKTVTESIEEEDRDRILIALNKCDRGSSNPKAKWDYEKGEPNDFLKLVLDEKAAEIRYRILESVGLKTNTPIYYSAGFYDEEEDKQCKSYNLDKLIAAIQKVVDKKRR